METSKKTKAIVIEKSHQQKEAELALNDKVDATQRNRKSHLYSLHEDVGLITTFHQCICAFHSAFHSFYNYDSRSGKNGIGIKKDMHS